MPFWLYYGGKFRLAPKYPKPQHDKIIEPFAGAAGYSLRYHWHQIHLYDVYPEVVETWKFLIRCSEQEMLNIPIVEHCDDLPKRLPPEAKLFVRWRLNFASSQPRKSLSAGLRRSREHGGKLIGWFPESREKLASQLHLIRHWRVNLASYDQIQNQSATWFIDPPYNNHQGKHYKHSSINYKHLASWSYGRKGQVIVCESNGAKWLPFSDFATSRSGPRTKTNKEVIFYRENNLWLP